MSGTVIPLLGGGLGNRLFQYAAAAGLAEKWGRTVSFAPSRIEQNNHGHPLTIHTLFPDVPIEEPEEMWANPFHEEPPLFDYEPFPQEAPTSLPVTIQGWFQSEKYFPREGVIPNWDSALEERRAEISHAANLEGPVERRRTWMIHFRYGDYIFSPLHHVNLRLYYLRCLMSIPDGARLHVFSDNPEFCRDFILDEVGERLEVTWATAKRDVESLYEMSLCWGGAIVANSTFSWWGAYFARQACGGPFVAYYPDNWGAGLPPATDVVPSWGERVFTAA